MRAPMWAAVCAALGVAGASGADEACCRVEITAVVPPDTGPVYLAGGLEALGPWRADGLEMTGEGAARTAVLTVPAGTTFEYKFTLGDWEREAVDPQGFLRGNNQLAVSEPTAVRHEVAGFRLPTEAYLADPEGAGIMGRIVTWRDVPSAHLELARHVQVWLPPAYDAEPERRFPVLLMHDGQNLFDPRIANTGVDWGVDEAITTLAAAGAIDPPIVVATWSTQNRGAEYSPWHGAPQTARFFVEELLPRVRAEFRTLDGPENTTAMGSSMGGLLSLFLVREHPDVFGACGCLSTHFVLSEAVAARYGAPGVDPETADPTPYIDLEIAAGATLPPGTRYWFDYGTEGLDATYEPVQLRVRDWLLAQDLEEGADFAMRRYDGADHNEAAWRARLEDPLRFLFAAE